MKQFYLTAVFTVYHLFVPFIVLNCASSDLPYVVENASAADASESALAECQALEFLTDDCVTLMQAEEDRVSQLEEAIGVAYDDLPEFISCQSMTVAETSDCEEIIAAMQDGYEACLAESEDDRGFTCDQIISYVSTAADKCDAGDTSVTSDFCGELS